MEKEYQALRDAVVAKIRSKEFCTIEDGKHTKTIRIFDGETHYDVVLWTGNGAEWLKTYNDSDISCRFKEEDKQELFDLISLNDGDVHYVDFDMHGNDLYFKINQTTIFNGYNDKNWWDNVSPRLFEQHRIKNIDGRHYQFPECNKS